MGHKRISLWRLLISIVMTMLILPLSIAWAQESTPGQTLTDQIQQSEVTATTTKTLNLRSKPGSGAVIGWLPNGTTVPVLGRNNTATWLFVEHGSKRGWIAGWLATINGALNTVPITQETGAASGDISAPAESSQVPDAVMVTARTTMNIREGPGVSYRALAQLPGGTALPVLGRNAANSWLLIEYSTTRGWVARSLCRIKGNLANVPIVDVSGGTTQSSSLAPTLTTQPITSYTVHLSNVGPHLQAIYDRGRTLGNTGNRFSKVGDSETYNGHYLLAFDTGNYNLGGYGYLQAMITKYSGSYGHMGYATMSDFMVETILNPTWSDATICRPNETPLACEYRVYHPSVAIIMVRTKTWNQNWQDNYLKNLREIVRYTVNQGIIPVLTTLPSVNGHETFNHHIRAIGNEFNVPVWDLYATTITLPNAGLGPDAYHLSIPPGNIDETINITAENLQYGVIYRNLQTLEVLHILNAIVH